MVPDDQGSCPGAVAAVCIASKSAKEESHRLARHEQLQLQAEERACELKSTTSPRRHPMQNYTCSLLVIVMIVLVLFWFCSCTSTISVQQGARGARANQHYF